MNNQDNLAEEISRFLEGEMNEDEKKQFEESIAKNPDLAGEVKAYMSIIGAVREVGFEGLRAKLRKRTDEKLAGKFKTGKFRKYRWVVFFTITVVIFSIPWFFNPNRKVKIKSTLDCSIRPIMIIGTENLGTGIASPSKADKLVLQLCLTSLNKDEYWFKDSIHLFVQTPEQWGQVEFQFDIENGHFVLINKDIVYPLKRNTAKRQILESE